MNHRSFPIPATAAAGLFALATAAGAAAQPTPGTTVEVEARAPLQATLLPAVRVTASRGRPDALAQVSIASDAPQQVTLMPTVRVNAGLGDLADTAAEAAWSQYAATQLDDWRTFAFELGAMPLPTLDDHYRGASMRAVHGRRSAR
jgi:hypothetical protein